MTPAASDERVGAWCALLDAGLSGRVLRRLHAEFGAPMDVLDADDRALTERGGLRAEQLRRLRESASDRIRHDRQLETFHQFGMSLLEAGSSTWPPGLVEADGQPPVLFVRGRLLPEDALAISIVGPRMATPYGLDVARRFAARLAPIVTVASGCALGIDSAAHQAALDVAGRTFGVAACGLEQDYPKGNAPLRERLAAQGAIVSAYPPLTKPATHRFPERNGLMAALSLGVLVVEASAKSGALVTATAAAELGREVFAVPGDITRRNSDGANQLLREGACVATHPDDILAVLEGVMTRELARIRTERETRAPAPPPVAPLAAGTPEAIVLDALREREHGFDELHAALVPARMTRGAFATALLQLEIAGRIRQLPGKRFVAR